MRTIKSLMHCLSILTIINISCLHAQDLLEDASEEVTTSSVEGIFSETVNIISRSGKIFIMSNSNQLLGKGDFITLILKQSGPVARAVVAKNHDGQTGVKILKVYSLSRWKQIRKGVSLDILKGDDSALFKPQKTEEEKIVEDAKIASEEDLFNDKSLIDEDLSDFYRDSRIIKPDNIVSGAYNQFIFDDLKDNSKVGATNFNIGWAYQFSDNYWAEGLLGYALVNGYPVQGTQTAITSFSGRFKYIFKAPLYSYFLPYVGFQTISVSSPKAGVDDGNTSQTDLAAEEETIKEIEKTHLIAGVTFLRRLVPGWFVKVDLGNDFSQTYWNVGFAIEF